MEKWLAYIPDMLSAIGTLWLAWIAYCTSKAWVQPEIVNSKKEIVKHLTSLDYFLKNFTDERTYERELDEYSKKEKNELFATLESAIIYLTWLIGAEKEESENLLNAFKKLKGRCEGKGYGYHRLSYTLYFQQDKKALIQSIKDIK